MRARRTSPSLSLLLLALSLCGTARADAPLAPVIARFALEGGGASDEQLVLVRTADRIEHRFVRQDTSEHWLRDAHGELEHVKAFPREGRSVHYTAGDLRTIQSEPRWDALASLIGSDERATLRTVGAARVLGGRAAQVLAGTLRGEPARVVWLEALALPARLELGRGPHKRVVRLLGVDACTEARCAAAELGSLRSLEFADLGDKEYDPFVRRFVAAQGHRHP